MGLSNLYYRVRQGSLAAATQGHAVTAKIDAKMAAQDARSFVNNIYYGGFDDLLGQPGFESGPIVEAIRSRSLEALPLELKLDLYEAIANDAGPGEGNVHYLDALNKEMGLTGQFYADQTAEAEQFFAETNTPHLENRWAEAGLPGSFSHALHTQIHADGGLESPQAQALARFIIKEYANFIGQPCPEINFVNEAPNACGATGTKPDGTEYINLNVNAAAFQGNFLAAIDTQLHEFKHIQQKNLARQYLAGEIQKGDPDYLAARVFAANLQTKSGYISPPPFHDRMTAAEIERYKQGFKAYEDQPSEVDARTFGKAAAHAALKTYGENPPSHNLNAKYDGMVDTRVSFVFACETGAIIIALGDNGNMPDFPFADLLLGDAPEIGAHAYA